MTILCSAILDCLVHKCHSQRAQLFGILWILFAVLPLLVLLEFLTSKSKIAFGIVMSMMGISFGTGLAQIPALISDFFGNDKYGFAFGIAQIGSIVAAAITLPMMSQVGRTGTIIIFAFCAAMHVLCGGLLCYKSIRLNRDLKTGLLDEEQ
jgi:MFS family permease